MRRKVVIIASLGVVFLASVTVIVGWILHSHTFSLSQQYYGQSGFIEVSKDELTDLIEEKQSFALFVYQPNCQASKDFEEILQKFSDDNQITFPKIAFSEVKNTGLVEGLRFYPSVALYHDGELVNFLKTDQDSDLAAFQSYDGFRAWWDRYVSKQ